jgi:protein-disulfide isomerase
MAKKQSEPTSKRQMRKEEVRRKERQQRMITVGALAVAAIALLALIIVPSIQKAANPGGAFVKVTPVNYPDANGTNLGDPNAKVKIQVFEDFQCSACKAYTRDVEPDVISKIVETGMAYYEFYQYPFLDQGTYQDSHRAALAAECAAAQNRFWDYKRILFANSTEVAGEFPDARLTAFAQSLKLNMSDFETCLNTAKFQSKVDADIKLGNDMGVTGTPSLFVDGKEVSPGKVPTYDQIYQAVQQAQQGG